MRLTSKEGILFNPDPAAYLPHRNPFLLIDRLLALEPGIAATGQKLISHDPAGFPPFFLIEAMAQLAGIAAADQNGAGGFLAAIDKAEISGSVEAGDTLQITARILKGFGRLYLVEGEVQVAGRTVAAATMTIGIGKL